MITHQQKGAVCEICGEELPDKRSLIKHKAAHISTVDVSRNSLTEKIFPCTRCGKVSFLIF